MELIRRPAVAGTRWMVTAPHAGAALAGASMLQRGGSAADASIAAAAALSVLYPHMTGIGGDLFALYYDASRNETVVYNGSGAAARLATVEYYKERNFVRVPERGGAAANTVPGAVDAWFALHERYGKLEMRDVLEPAIGAARRGSPLARSVARSIEEERDVLVRDEGARRLFQAEHACVGDVLRQPALARTLERIATRGRSWFYEDEGAAAMERGLEKIGSPLRAADFRAHRGFWTTPLRAPFAGFESLTTPPNSQGVALLIAQSTYASLAGARNAVDCSAAFVHGLVEGTKLAYADRDRLVGDPSAGAALDGMLDPDRLQACAARIDPHRAASVEPSVADAGGTTYLACVDEDGNAASVIQSLYQHFGAGVAVEELGVMLHNRGCWFELRSDGPRALAPGRRPFHTLIANALYKDGEPALVYGSMGGDAQPQIGLLLSIRIGERGMEPQAALDAPRWRWNGNTCALAVESRIGAASVAGLRARGHLVEVCGEYEEMMGHAGAIVIDRERGVLLGAADPRSDGAAIGV